MSLYHHNFILSFSRPSLPEFSDTFQQADNLPFSVDTGDLNRVWCVAAVLGCLEGHGDVESRSSGVGAGVWDASNGCESTPSGTAEARHLQMSIPEKTVLCVIFLGAPFSFPVCSNSPRWPCDGGTEGPQMSAVLLGKCFDAGGETAQFSTSL